jgi:hypothetical protein
VDLKKLKKKTADNDAISDMISDLPLRHQEIISTKADADPDETSNCTALDRKKVGLKTFKKKTASIVAFKLTAQLVTIFCMPVFLIN